MRLYSLSVLYKGEPRVRLLKAAYDVSSFSFFQRSRCVLQPRGERGQSFGRFCAPLRLHWQQGGAVPKGEQPQGCSWGVGTCLE